MRTRTRWIVAAIGAATLAAITATILATGSTAPRHMASATPATCDAGPADTTIPDSPPTDLAWKSIGPMHVPTSKTYGPTWYDGPLWRCYRHDPMGAVLAACDIFAEAITANWHQVADAQFVTGPGQQAYIAASERQAVQLPSPGEVAQPVGFEVTAYTPQQATIETLADAGDDDEYQALALTVQWSGGDWKLWTNDDGNTGPDPQLVGSASGFILWAGDNG